jgi:hypothetical protein
VRLAFFPRNIAGIFISRQSTSGGTTDFAFVPSLGRTRFFLNHNQEKHMQSPAQDERTQELPAQEREAAASQPISVLTAEQVYAQRLADTPFPGQVPGPSFVP